jgi:hypothetical protein
LSLPYWEDAGTWSTNPLFGLGQNPPEPPLTYTFHIESGGTVYPINFVMPRFVEEYPTNLSPTGSVLGEITFSWTGISLPDVNYRVELYDPENGFGIWLSNPTLDTSINYSGPPLSLGSRYGFVVLVQDSYGNFSAAMAEFVYEPLPL